GQRLLARTPDRQFQQRLPRPAALPPDLRRTGRGRTPGTGQPRPPIVGFASGAIAGGGRITHVLRGPFGAPQHEGSSLLVILRCGRKAAPPVLAKAGKGRGE